MININCVVSPDEVLWNNEFKTHEELFKYYRISSSNYSNYLKVNINFCSNLVKPKLNISKTSIIDACSCYVDISQHTLPKWLNYTNEKIKNICMKTTEHWINSIIIKSGTHTFSGKLQKIILGGNVTINDLEFGGVMVYNNSKLKSNNMKSGCIELYNRSYGCINNQSGGVVRFFDNSVEEVINQSGEDVWFYDECTGTVNNQTGGKVRFYNNSTGEVNNQSGGNVDLYEN